MDCGGQPKGIEVHQALLGDARGTVTTVFRAFWLVGDPGFRPFFPHFGWFGVIFGHFCAFRLVCIVFLRCFLSILAGTQTLAQGPGPAYPPKWSRNTAKTPCCTAEMGRNGRKSPPAPPKMGEERPKTRAPAPPKRAKHRSNGPTGLPTQKSHQSGGPVR